ncbi:unnamed protein product [Polarella glacialis]|uniref:Alkaline ceramidase n=1 Tax=Polarella glacialis TaxID=89957 RepID=A0A813G3B6_POLGL|nr:unnamed protein product [Polarella glacialis]
MGAVRVLRVVLGVVLLLIFPLFALLIARGPVDGAGDEREGYWGPKTANVNWCEADYIFTHYIAEFVNSLSSLSIVASGLYGISAHWTSVECRYLVAFASMVVVGVGSFAFHATLLRPMQLLDEVPMIWGNSVFVYILLTMEDKEGRTRTIEIWAISLMTLLMTVLITLFDTSDQNIFLLCYGSGVVYLVLRSRTLNLKYSSETSMLLMDTATVLYAGAFLLCLLDRNFCSAVRSFQLHALWHIGAELGTVSGLLFWIWIRHEVRAAKARLMGSNPATWWIQVLDKAV